MWGREAPLKARCSPTTCGYRWGTAFGREYQRFQVAEKDGMNLRRAVTLARSSLNSACATQQRSPLTGPFIADLREGPQSAEPSLGWLEEPSKFVESHDGCQSSGYAERCAFIDSMPRVSFRSCPPRRGFASRDEVVAFL
jgi:hypothetical protein